MSACRTHEFISIEEFNNKLLSLDDFAKVLREATTGEYVCYIPEFVETAYNEQKFTLDEWIDLINGVMSIEPAERALITYDIITKEKPHNACLYKTR